MDKLNDDCLVAGLRAARDMLMVRRSTEQIMRDRSRIQKDHEISNAHGDRAQVLTEQIDAISARIATIESGSEE